MADASPRYLIPEDVVARELADESLLVHLGTGTYFGLDATGTRIWQLLSEHGSADAVLAELLVEFDVDEPRLRRDLADFIARLLDKGLLVAG